MMTWGKFKWCTPLFSVWLGTPGPCRILQGSTDPRRSRLWKRLGLICRSSTSSSFALRLGRHHDHPWLSMTIHDLDQWRPTASHRGPVAQWFSNQLSGIPMNEAYWMIQRYPEMASLKADWSLKKSSFCLGFCIGCILSFDDLVLDVLWWDFQHDVSGNHAFCPASSQVPNMCLWLSMYQSFDGIWMLVDCILTILACLKRSLVEPSRSNRRIIFPNLLLVEVVSNEIDPKAGATRVRTLHRRPCLRRIMFT